MQRFSSKQLQNMRCKIASPNVNEKQDCDNVVAFNGFFFLIAIFASV